jgi:putative phosphoribosyl transferase
MFQEITFEHQNKVLHGHMSWGEVSQAWVIFAHGSGSSRKSARNNWVASELNKRGFATLLFDLLTLDEDAVYMNRFNIPLLGRRLLTATEWLVNSEFYHGQPLAYFGASTGAGAALSAAAVADPSWPLFSIISRGGRPDLAGIDNLGRVNVPTLLIVGEEDEEVIKLNEKSLLELPQARLELVEGATHLFEEEGALAQVVELSVHWLKDNLQMQPVHNA